MNYFCYDSELSVAELIVDGHKVDAIEIGQIPLDSEDSEEYSEDDYGQDEVADPASGDDRPAAPDHRSIISSEDADLVVKADLDIWLTTLGRSSQDDFMKALERGRYERSANQIAYLLMIGFGIADNRLHMAYRFYERGEDANEFTRFIAIPAGQE